MPGILTLFCTGPLREWRHCQSLLTWSVRLIICVLHLNDSGGRSSLRRHCRNSTVLLVWIILYLMHISNALTLDYITILFKSQHCHRLFWEVLGCVRTFKGRVGCNVFERKSYQALAIKYTSIAKKMVIHLY